MTREEAIRTLFAIKDELMGRHFSYKNHPSMPITAIDMAIEALQREEAEEKGYCHRIIPKGYFKNDATKPSNDLINRADAIERIANDNVVGGMEQINEYNNSTEYNGYLEGISDAITTTFDVPSAEQVISKLNNPCDSLVTDESNGSKEHKSKLDLISRQDVIEALCRSSVYAWSIEQDQTAHNWALNIIKALPSADAMPTVIRSKTFMRKEDFDKWADDIKKQNKSIVCIPCDAEVVSADSVVRCKDCKYSFYDKDYESYNCRKHEYVECFDADDYCSWGERND